MSSLPFAHLNLRRNPFGEFSAEERAQLAVLDLEPAIAHLSSAVANGRGAVVQVLGEKGFGKTTHLLALYARYPGASYVYIAEGERATIPATGEPLLIDEAQRLTVLQRIQLFRSTRTLILGTHYDFESALRRCGRSVLSLTANRHTAPERVWQILNQRIEFVRRGDGDIPSVSPKTVQQLLAEFGCDLRSMQHSLYDRFQKLGRVQDV